MRPSPGEGLVFDCIERPARIEVMVEFMQGNSEVSQMDRKRQVSFLIGIFLLMFMLFFIVVVAIMLFMFTDEMPAMGRSTVALVNVKGVITDAGDCIRQLRKYAQSPGIKAIVLRIESPGGAVGASQELHHRILQLRKDGAKPIVASMGNVGASGGIYVASAADEIYANPGTVTGSIGVIFRTYDLQGISRKIGVDTQTVKSGKYKDIGSSFREMTPEEREILQAAIDDTYDQFIEALLDGRQKPLAEAYLRRDLAKTTVTVQADAESTAPAAARVASADPQSVPRETVREYVRSIADGRIYTGRQAMELGLVDHMGDLHDAVVRALELAGVSGRPRIVQETRTPTLWDLVQGRSDVLSRLGLPNGWALEYRLDFQ